MRKCFLTAIAVCVCMMFWTTGCTERKPIADSLAVDSVIDTTLNVDTMEQLIEEQPMPVAADELFDDFIFNFAANHKLQMKRIKFPLQVDDFGEKTSIAKSGWKMEHFFMEQGFYTLIFDSEKQMNVVKDTTINNVVVEKINLVSEKVKDYVFKRINGTWMLVAIRKCEMSQHPCSSFLSFYQKFATDASFQERSLNNPVTFTGQDHKHFVFSTLQPIILVTFTKSKHFIKSNRFQHQTLHFVPYNRAHIGTILCPLRNQSRQPVYRHVEHTEKPQNSYEQCSGRRAVPTDIRCCKSIRFRRIYGLLGHIPRR